MLDKHQNLMKICVLVVVGVIAAVLLLKIPLRNGLLFILLLACPLSHILMMRLMSHNSGENHHDHENTNQS
jgi:choline-glycine betaine transporter